MALVITGGIQFTGGFTWINPPITYFTDPYYNNVILHLNGETPIPLYISDASPNTTAITTAGNVISSRFSPIWPVGYYSNQFDGSTGYLTFPGTPALSFAAALTIELWYYPTASLTNAGILDGRASSTSVTGVLLRQGDNSSNGLAVCVYWNNGSTTVYGGQNMVLNQWNHIAVTRTAAGVITVYVNGVGGTTATYATALTDGATNTWYLGRFTGSVGAGNYTTGYISNLRVVNGTVVYSANFTPPTSPLTAVNGTQTTLLTCIGPNFTDYSPRGNVLTSNGTVKVQPNQPFGALPSNATLPAYQNGYYSNNFAATSYIKTQSLPYFSPTNQAFTMEAWIYLTSFTVGSTGNGGIIAAGTVNTNPNVVGMYFVGSTGVLNWYNGSNLASWTALTLNTWYHIAYSRLGTGTNQTMGFVNGQLVAVFTDSSTYTSPMPFYVGTSVYGAANNAEYFPGYISNARMVVGTAVYTNFFTPSTAPLTVVNGTQTVLLTSLNGTISDSSPWNNTMTNTTATVSIQSPFTIPTTSVTGVTNYGSAQFDGSTGYMTTPYNATLCRLSGNFTVECWLYWTVHGSYGGIMGSANSNTGAAITAGWYLDFNSTNNTIQFEAQGSLAVVSTNALTINSWNHIAAVRNGSTVTVYINGASNGTGTSSAVLDSLTYNFQIGVDRGVAAYTGGYISNARVVNGSAVYTTNFVPSNQPLTAANGTTSSTTLLTLQTRQSNNNNVFYDDSPNNLAITRYGTPTQGTFTPFSQNGWSNYFDGSTGVQSLPYTTSNFDWWTSSFTLECWIYTTTYAGLYGGSGQGSIIGNMNYNAAANQWSLGVNSSGKPIWFYYNGSLVFFTGTTTVSLNQWTHLAFCYTPSNSTMYLFVNGFPSGTQTVSGTPTSTPGENLTIGAFDNAYLSGYLSNIRVTKGAALYTTAFTPPTAALTTATGTTGTVTLLTARSNRFIDNSTASNTISSTGTVAVKSFSPFTNMSAGTVPTGLYSDWFSGTSSYLSAPSNAAFAVGTGAFTVEMWIYWTGAYATTTRLFSTYTSGIVIYPNTSGNLVYGVYAGTTYITSSVTIPLNTWIHVAVARSGTTSNMYFNGVSVGSSSSDSASYSQAGAYIGSDNGTYFWTGYISNLRFVSGYALYTANFTPSTSPLAAVPGTVLLTAQNSTFTDASTLSNVISVTGNVQAIEVSPFVIPSTQSLTSNTYTTNLVGGSVYFNGSTDYLSLPSSPIGFNNNYTVEAWVYPTASGDHGIFYFGGNSNTYAGLRIGWNSGTPGFYILVSNDGSTWGINSSSAVGGVAMNQWYHIAVVKTGTTFQFYLNGILAYTTTLSGTNYAGSLNYIGTYPGYYFNGYIANARVVNGAVLYTGTFAVPTLPPSVIAPISTTTIASTSLLLLGTNGGVNDQSGRNLLVTNSATISASTFRTGASSIYFASTGSYAQTTGTNYWIPTTMSSFTVEAWIYMTQPASPVFSLIAGDAAPLANINNWGLGVNGSNQLQFYWYSGVGNYSSSTSVLSTGTWYHVAASINSGTIGLFVNGVRQVNSGLNTLTNRSTTLNSISVGGYYNGTFQYYGYIDDLRITQGVARYSSTASFIAPTVGLPVQ
jgi:hypothetical protein